MSDWLLQAAHAETPVSPSTVAVRLALAVFAGGLVAAACYAAHGRRKTDASMLTTTLTLLTVLIAMVTLVIGDSIARAFGLVGALSIVRFRTVVDDTRDTAFVIFAVIVGMAIGAGQLLLPLIGIPMVGVAAVLLDRAQQRRSTAASSATTLNVRLSLGRDPDLLFQEIFAQHTEHFRVIASSTARQGAALDVTYRLRLRAGTSLTALVTTLNQIEGVQNAELRGE